MDETPSEPDMRIERDFLGECPIPETALYGVHTVRAMNNFRLCGRQLGECPRLVVALARTKVAAARANRDLGILDPRTADAIVSAAQNLVEGRFRDHLVVEMLQGGGGTSMHMNINEVLANLAGEFLGAARGEYVVHPNDHVNRSQSTNDVIPTAVGLAVYDAVQECLDQLRHLRRALLDRADAHSGMEHLGRTCLRDALPVPVPAVHGAQASAVERAAGGLAEAARQLLEVPLGATAVGTGLGTPAGYRALAVRYLAEETGLNIVSAADPFESLAFLEPFATVADRMAAAARVCARIAADLRLLSSGPIGGFGEVQLPAVQAGSSAMPGKVNPVIPELVLQMFYRVAGAAHTVRLASAAGELEVSPMTPVVVDELLTGLDLLGGAARAFADRCIADLVWLPRAVEGNLRGSLTAAVDGAVNHGYEASARDVYLGSAAAKTSGANQPALTAGGE